MYVHCYVLVTMLETIICYIIVGSRFTIFTINFLLVGMYDWNALSSSNNAYNIPNALLKKISIIDDCKRINFESQ